MLWMAPSLEENIAFNEGGRKEELPAVPRKASLFSFASFPLLMGMREAGPIHPCSTPIPGSPRSPHRQHMRAVPAGLPSAGVPPCAHIQVVRGWPCLRACGSKVYFISSHMHPRCYTGSNSVPFPCYQGETEAWEMCYPHLASSLKTMFD